MNALSLALFILFSSEIFDGIFSIIKSNYIPFYVLTILVRFFLHSKAFVFILTLAMYASVSDLLPK